MVFILGFNLIGCSENNRNVQKFVQTEFLLGTIVTLTVYDENADSLDGAFELCRKYENILSSNIEGSDVWRINHAEGSSVSVSSETAELIELSLEFSRMTDGAFDITVAPLSVLWNFSGESPSVPSQDSISALLPLVDYTCIDIDGNTVTLPAGRSIELGAIAKGYISDKLCEYFKECGTYAAIVNLGGNVATVGTKPDGSDWQIGVRDPYGDTSSNACTLFLDETSVVTSGIYERCFEQDGILYHHILDPHSGYPVNNDLASVTVICQNGARADALSTTLFLMGYEDAYEYAQSSEDIEAIFILTNGEIRNTDGVNFK